MMYTDQMGRTFKLSNTPVRIVSLVPSQTELLVDLSLADHIVGVTKFCVHPDTIRKEKNIVGGTKTIHLEKIRAIQPDIILCNKEENTEEIVTTLEKEFPVHVSDIYTIDDALELIVHYGDIFEKKDHAQDLIATIRTEQASFQEFMNDISQKKVAYFIWRNPWMVAGKGTFINHLLAMNNYENVFDHQDRYPEVSEEELMRLDEVDTVLLSSEPFPFSEKHKLEMKNIYPKTQIILVDGECFSWYGSRLVGAFRYFRTLHSK